MAQPPDDSEGDEPALVGQQNRENTTNRWKLTPRREGDMPTVMIIGASRGIGLELARQYAAAGWRVHATTRTPAQPGALGASVGRW